VFGDQPHTPPSRIGTNAAGSSSSFRDVVEQLAAIAARRVGYEQPRRPMALCRR
jgi:hypothetical protein